LLHGCPGPHNLSQKLASEIVGVNTNEDYTPDVPDFQIQERLQRIAQSTPSVAKDLGDIDAKVFCKIIVHYRLNSLNVEEIEQIKEGLSFADVMPTLRNFPKDAMKELTSCGEITVNEFKNLFEILYSQEDVLKVKEEDIIFKKMSQFLTTIR